MSEKLRFIQMRGEWLPIFSNKQAFFLFFRNHENKNIQRKNINKTRESMEWKIRIVEQQEKVWKTRFLPSLLLFSILYSHKQSLCESAEKKQTFRRIDRKFLIWIFYLRQVSVWVFAKTHDEIYGKYIQNEVKQNITKQEQQ